MRVKRTRQILNRADCAVLVVDGTVGLSEADWEMVGLFQQKSIPYLIAFNKQDLSAPAELPEGAVTVSAKTGEGIEELKNRIAASSAPTGRLSGWWAMSSSQGRQSSWSSRSIPRRRRGG